jgi:hypothetical protein
MPWKYNGNIIKPGKPWTDDNGITHPSNWNIWSYTYKTGMGLVWFEPAVEPPVDKRFYYSAGVPKLLEDVAQVDENGDPILDLDGNQIISIGLRSEWIKKTKKTANDMLEKTDWYVLRKLDRAVEIPVYISDYRSAILQSCTNIELAINGAANLQEFMALFESVDGAPPTIHNWPEEVE